FEHGYVGGWNMGFRNWHPFSDIHLVTHGATTGGESVKGTGTMGGVWEWTSILECCEGFEPSLLYKLKLAWALPKGCAFGGP
ncbi:hypothetical protein F5148DRAFT_989201, partial [Russula earlei]